MALMEKDMKRVLSQSVLFALAFVILSLPVFALDQGGSVQDFAQAFGRGSGIIVAVLSQPMFMVALIILLIYLLIYQIVTLALSKAMSSGAFGGDSGEAPNKLRAISHALSGITTISILMGGSYEGGSLSPTTVETNVHNLMSSVSMLPLIFTILVAAIYLLTSLKNNPDMPKLKRFGLMMMVFGIGTWGAQGMVGSMWSSAGVLFFFIGLFLNIFHGAFRSGASPGFSSYGGSRGGDSGNRGNGFFSSIGSAIADRIRSGGSSNEEDAAEKKAKAAKKANKKKAKKLVHINSLHKPVFFKNKMIELSQFLKKEKENLSDEYEQVRKISDDLDDIHKKVDSLDPGDDKGTINPKIKELKDKLKEMEDLVKKQKKEDNFEGRIAKRAYRRDVRRVGRYLNNDYKKLISESDDFKKNWDRDSIEGYDEFLEEVENIKASLQNEINTFRNMKSAFQSIEATRQKLPSLEEELKHILKDVENLEKVMDNYDNMMKASSAQTDQGKRQELIREAENKKKEGIHNGLKKLSNTISSTRSRMDSFFTKFEQMASYFKTVEDLIANMLKINQHYEAVYNNAESTYSNVEKSVDKISDLSGQIDEAMKKLHKGREDIEKEYHDLKSSFSRILDLNETEQYQKMYDDFKKNSDSILAMSVEKIDGYNHLADLLGHINKGDIPQDIIDGAQALLDTTKASFSKLYENTKIFASVFQYITENKHLFALRAWKEATGDGISDVQRYSEMRKLNDLISQVIDNNIIHNNDVVDDNIKSYLGNLIKRQTDWLNGKGQSPDAASASS